MRKILTTLFFLLLCTISMAQEATFDFTKPWNPKTGILYADGDTVQCKNADTNGFTKNEGHLILYGQGAYITLPAFDFDVEKIVTIGAEGTSKTVTQNVFVGPVAVSTESTGSANADASAKTNEYLIKEDYQKAGTRYTIKVTNSGNSQITYVKVYKKGAAGKTYTTTTFGDDVDNALFVVPEGETFTGKTATTSPADVAGTLTYSSSNEGVATVDNSGNVALTKTRGTTRITATFTPSNLDQYVASSATYSIRYGTKAATALTFAKTSDTGYINVPYSLPEQTLSAGGTAIQNASLTYYSSDESVAKVKEDGTLELLGTGSTTITAFFEETEEYDGASAELTLYVKDVMEVTFTPGKDNSAIDTLTKEPVMMTITDGNLNSKSSYGLSRGATMTLTTSVGKITKVTFTAVAGKNCYLKGDEKYNDYSKTWYGNASSVSFMASTEVGTQAYIASVSVRIKTVDDIELTESAANDEAIASAMSKISNVKIDRTLKANDGWYTLCLPFAVDAKQMSALSGANVLAFTGMEGTVMKFTRVETMEAGRAYLVYPTKDIATPTFAEVKVSAGEPVAATTDYAFVGVYNPTALTTDGTNLFVGADGSQLYRPDVGKNTLKGLRAFFQVPSNTSESKLSIEADDTTLSVADIRDLQPAVGRVYSLQGQFLGTTTQGLKAGVYIVGGRKVVVK